jgi:hypothetical protein
MNRESPAYLQPGSNSVWPGGWHLEPPSFGLEWRRAFCNQWPDETEEGWNVISLDNWRRATG